jgi:2-phospho-L-lactate guanylyltransferase
VAPDNGPVTAVRSFPTARGWTILIPVKATSRGKSRLAVPDRLRPPLALAMAMDTASAAARCGRVLALVQSPADGRALSSIAGVDVRLSAAVGLNGAIVDGAKVVAESGVFDVTPWLAVLPGDLPGLDSVEFAAVLRQCERHPFAAVADHLGVGTTLLAATEVGALQPCYGPDSFQRHRRAGAIPIDLPTGSTLRWDVDTVDDLAVAPGPRTSAVLQDITAGRDRSPGAGVTVEGCTEDS